MSTIPHKKPQIRPDYDTDVLWRPPRVTTNRQRTISVDSTDSDIMPVTPTGRRFSLSGMLMGASAGIGGLLHRSSIENPNSASEVKKHSLSEQVDFKEFMLRQNRILSDEEGYRLKDYIK